MEKVYNTLNDIGHNKYNINYSNLIIQIQNNFKKDKKYL